MSRDNGVIRIGRKGLSRFAFGDGEPFEVDVVAAFQQWLIIDDGFRPQDPSVEDRSIPIGVVPEYHTAAQNFVADLAGMKGSMLTVAEALDFLARLREAYNDLVDFFQPKSREERASPDTSEEAFQFSVEES